MFSFHIFFPQENGKMDLNMAKESRQRRRVDMKENGEMTW